MSDDRMTVKSDFRQRINSLDTGLFTLIPSQTTEDDQKVLLTLQRIIRDSFRHYVYLEIGSHLGGSIQPHLLDPLCTKIYSIDKRPYIQLDERGIDQKYRENSTERMLKLLRSVAPEQMHKVSCFEDCSQNIASGLIEQRPQICFIDGEHTNRAVVRDFEFCLFVADPNGLIAFHDADLVHKGIRSILAGLRKSQVRFTGLKLSGSIFVILLGSCPAAGDSAIQQWIKNERLYFLSSHLRLVYKRWRNRWRNR